MTDVRHETFQALEVPRLAAAHGEDAATLAAAMMASAVRYLVLTGGRMAALAVLQSMAGRVARGHFPEPQHPPGNA